MRNVTLLKKAQFCKADREFAEVALPHTWNALDGQDGGGDYWRGTGYYKIQLPAPTPGKRQYIQFEGANHIAEVSCNGTVLGTHKGGFSTFRYELTDVLKDSGNVLEVAVSNPVCDVYPQMADFTFYGGIYRDLTFIEVENAHFDLLKDGTQGVFVTSNPAGKTRLDLFPVNADGCTVKVTLRSFEGEIVSTISGAAQEHTVLVVDVKEPHLWQGVEDPYCYTATAAIEKDGVVLDEVIVTYGYRSFHVDVNTGFYLNGKSMPLRGVARHQDRINKGWALEKADHDQDIAIIKEIGANTIRLAHYQHAQYFYDLCDKEGFVLWAEIPFISGFRPGKDAYDNTMSQMKELIAQNYNHPSICFWGLSNEITLGGDSEALLQNLRDLNALCKIMDPSRLSTMAQVSTVPMDSQHNYITDILSYNHYFGWYCGTVADNGPWFDAFHEKNPDRAIGCSEYGADAVLDWHAVKPLNHDYTEEYEAFYHHEMLKCFEKRPYLWSTHAWNMFDFAADSRNEGGSVGINNKGLVTYDRKTYKESFYIYQAYWTDKPMVHVCGERFPNRGPEEHEVIVYSNCDSVTLYVNGEAVETLDVVDHAAVFHNVPLNDGENTVTAKSGNVEGNTITLNAIPEADPGYILPRGEDDVPVGNWFDGIAVGTSDDDMEFPEGFYSVKDTVKDVCAIRGGKLIVELLANIGAFGPIVAIKTMQPPMPLMDFLPMVGNLPAGGMAYINSQMNLIPKE